MPDLGAIKYVFRTFQKDHPNNISEIDLVEHLLIKEKDTHHFDFSNFENEVIIRVYEKIDGLTYTLLSNAIYPEQYTNQLTGVTDNVVIIVLDGGGNDMKITLQINTTQGGPIPITGTVRDEIRI